MSLLKGGIIGAGFFAGFQAEAWNRISGAQIVAVADSLQGRSREFAARWTIPHSYTNAEEMLEKERLDFVDIATRPESHVELVSKVAESGTHVICQKPMAPTWAESIEMGKLCRRADVRLLMHENWRWQPWYREIKRLLDSNRFGKPFHVSFRMRTGDGRGDSPYAVQPYFREMPQFVVYEVIVHFIDTFRYLLGEIESVFCQINRINPVIQGEDYVVVQLTFSNKVRGLIDANRISGKNPVDVTLGTFHLEGEKAMVELSPDGKLWLTDYGNKPVQHDFPTTQEGYKGDSVFALQKNFIECLNTGSHCETEGDDYLKTVAAVFACYESAENGRVVSISDWMKREH